MADIIAKMKQAVPTSAKSYIRAQTRRVQRHLVLGNLDTVTAVKRRSADFPIFLEAIRNTGTSNLEYFKGGYSFEGGLRLQQTPEEFAALCVLLREHAPYVNYVEIGSASGGTCLFLSQQIGFSHLISIDDGNHPDSIYQESHFSQIANLKRYIGDSHAEGARIFLEENLEGKIDIAFVDGDHSHEGVVQDIALIRQFSRPGTLILLHDTVACEGVDLAWLDSVRTKSLEPVAEYIGSQLPLGIAVGKVR